MLAAMLSVVAGHGPRAAVGCGPMPGGPSLSGSCGMMPLSIAVVC